MDFLSKRYCCHSFVCLVPDIQLLKGQGRSGGLMFEEINRKIQVTPLDTAIFK